MLTLIRRIFLTMILLTISLQVNGSNPNHVPIEKSWEEICASSKNAVFKIFSSIVQYDLREPYKSPERYVGSGTGFCIDSNGLVVTNYHVIENAVSIVAQLPELGKEQLELTLIGTCPSRDIALLRFTDNAIARICKKLEVETLPYLTLGNSNSLRDAQELMALGYPCFEAENLKSSIGHQSGREIILGIECIQTTAPINGGNSGGPFFDKKGHVIGICVAKRSETDGIAFLIPINTLTIIFQELLKSTLIRFPEWGAEVNSTNSELLAMLQCPFDYGVYVHDIKTNSVAEKAGIKTGDILFALNESPIDHYGYVKSPYASGKIFFTDLLYQQQPMYTKNILSVYRNGATLDLPVELYPADRLPIDYIYPCIDHLPECEVIGGLVITEVCMNHIDQMKDYATRYGDCAAAFIACKYDKFENRQQNRVGITRIISNSEAFRSNCFNTYSPLIFLKKINGQEVFTMNDVRQAILSGCEQPNLIIEADDGKLMVLSIQKIIAETPQLMQRYRIPLSPFIENLAQQLNHQLQGKEA